MLTLRLRSAFFSLPFVAGLWWELGGGGLGLAAGSLGSSGYGGHPENPDPQDARISLRRSSESLKSKGDCPQLFHDCSLLFILRYSLVAKLLSRIVGPLRPHGL